MTKNLIFVALLQILVIAIIFTAVIAGCGVPQEQRVTEAPHLLADLHGKILYETYSVDKEDYPYLVTHKDLYVLDLDTSPYRSQKLVEFNFSENSRLFEFETTRIPSPVPSPDNERIAFFGKDGLYVLDVDTNNVEKIVEATRQIGDHYIAWHPNGQLLAYVHAGDLYVVNIDGTGWKKIADHQGSFYTRVEGWIEEQIRRPTWLRNGSILLFDDFSAPSGMRYGSMPRSIYTFSFEKQARNLFREYFVDTPYIYDIIGPILPSSSLIPNDEVFISNWDWCSIAKFDGTQDRWELVNEPKHIYSEGLLLSPEKGKFLSFRGGDTLEYFNHAERKRISLRGFLKEALGGAWSPNGQYAALSGRGNGILILEPNTQNVAVILVEQEDYIQVIAWY